jgi:hypothetical protein
VTAIQAVFTATVAVVAVAIGLVVAGVAVLAGPAWALVAAGGLLGPAAIGAGWAVLRESGPS